MYHNLVVSGVDLFEVARRVNAGEPRKRGVELERATTDPQLAVLERLDQRRIAQRPSAR